MDTFWNYVHFFTLGPKREVSIKWILLRVGELNIFYVSDAIYVLKYVFSMFRMLFLFGKTNKNENPGNQARQT